MNAFLNPDQAAMLLKRSFFSVITEPTDSMENYSSKTKTAAKSESEMMPEAEKPLASFNPETGTLEHDLFQKPTPNGARDWEFVPQHEQLEEGIRSLTFKIKRGLGKKPVQVRISEVVGMLTDTLTNTVVFAGHGKEKPFREEVSGDHIRKIIMRKRKGYL